MRPLLISGEYTHRLIFPLSGRTEHEQHDVGGMSPLGDDRYIAAYCKQEIINNDQEEI